MSTLEWIEPHEAQMGDTIRVVLVIEGTVVRKNQERVFVETPNGHMWVSAMAAGASEGAANLPYGGRASAKSWYWYRRTDDPEHEPEPKKRKAVKVDG